MIGENLHDAFDGIELLPGQVATMRDGVRLVADVYRPCGDGPWPVLLMRQPYGRDIASTVVYAPPSCVLHARSSASVTLGAVEVAASAGVDIAIALDSTAVAFAPCDRLRLDVAAPPSRCFPEVPTPAIRWRCRRPRSFAVRSKWFPTMRRVRRDCFCRSCPPDSALSPPVVSLPSYLIN